MKREAFIASALAFALAIQAPIHAQKMSVREFIVRLMSEKKARKNYIKHNVQANILPDTIAITQNSFVKNKGLEKARKVVSKYYNLIWNEYDLVNKIRFLKEKNTKNLQKMFKLLTGWELSEAIAKTKKGIGPFIKLSLISMIRSFTPKASLDVLIGIPIVHFVNLFPRSSIIVAILFPALVATRLQKNFMSNRKKYRALRPFFRQCNRMVPKDWKRWNTDEKIQRIWIKKTIFE